MNVFGALSRHNLYSRDILLATVTGKNLAMGTVLVKPCIEPDKKGLLLTEVFGSSELGLNFEGSASSVGYKL